MKVLHLIDSGGLYGAEVMLLELVKEQIGQGIDAHVYSIGKKGIEEKEIEKSLKILNVPLHKERMMSGLNISGAMKIMQYAQNNQFEIIHSHGYKPSILLGVLPGFMRKIPIVRTLHGWTSTNIFSKIYLYELIDVFLLKRSSAVAAVSASVIEKKGVDKSKIKNFTVIENGISAEIPVLNDQDPVVKKILEIKDKGFLLGSIGRLSYEKAFDILLKAFSELKRCNQKYKLIIVGDGEQRENLFKIAKDLCIADDVFFLGYQNNASQYISLMDAYINSSRTEGMPITLLEAMRVGCPIVATNVGGVAEMLNHGEYGELVGSEDIQGLAQAIQNINTNPESKDKIKNFFKKKFTSSIMAQKYKALYTSLLDKKQL